MPQDALDDLRVVDMRHDAHLVLALGTQQRINLPALLDQLAPRSRRNAPRFERRMLDDFNHRACERTTPLLRCCRGFASGLLCTLPALAAHLVGGRHGTVTIGPRRTTPTTRIIAARECASRAHIAINSLFSDRNDLCPSFDSLARRSALDSCQILRATSYGLQFCSVSAMIPSAHPSRLRSKLQPRARLFASSTLVFRCVMTACHSRPRSLS